MTQKPPVCPICYSQINMTSPWHWWSRVVDKDQLSVGNCERGRLLKNWAEVWFTKGFKGSHWSTMTSNRSASGQYVRPGLRVCMCKRDASETEPPQCVQRGSLGAPFHGAKGTRSTILTHCALLSSFSRFCTTDTVWALSKITFMTHQKRRLVDKRKIHQQAFLLPAY